MQAMNETTTLPATDARRWKALGVIALIQFMLVLDITVVNVALSHIQSDLGFSRASLAWVVDGYVLTAGGLILLGGRLADLLGRKRMFLAGVAVFAAASAASGFAVDPGMLIASRFLQGAGEALAAPAGFGLIALLFTEPTERAKAIGISGGVAGLGGTLGPILSGLLISGLSWRWIFFINVPVAAFALVSVNRLVAESRADRRPNQGRPDLGGGALVTAGLVGVVYGLVQAATHPWGSASVVGPLLAGLVLVATFAVHERRSADPLMPRGFLGNRTRLMANVAGLWFAAAFFTLFYLLTLYWEQVQGWSALRVGLSYLPFGVVITFGIGMAASLIPRVGVKVPLVAGSTLFAAGVLLMSRITPGGSYWTQAFPAILVAAIGAGLCFSAFGNASMHEVSGQDAGLAAGMRSTSQQVGGALGLAV
ncbi:MAG: MFS transporter, partial [Acidimicrobiaceae bacterium]|nr:MFS transporter [Acidimicrobiaceae bacterium]